MNNMNELLDADFARIFEGDPDEMAHAEALARIAAPRGPSLLQVFGEALRPDGAA